MLELGVYALIVRGSGKDLLMGVNVNNYVKVQGLEHLLRKFISDLDINFEHIYTDDVHGFLNAMNKQFHIDFLPLEKNLSTNITEMHAVSSDDIMIFYLVITKTLEFLRNGVFENRGKEWINEILEEQTHNVPKDFMNRIESLDISQNPDVSLLYNLIFTWWLAEHYHDDQVQEECRGLVSKSLKKLF